MIGFGFESSLNWEIRSNEKNAGHCIAQTKINWLPFDLQTFNECNAMCCIQWPQPFDEHVDCTAKLSYYFIICQLCVVFLWFLFQWCFLGYLRTHLRGSQLWPFNFFFSLQIRVSTFHFTPNLLSQETTVLLWRNSSSIYSEPIDNWYVYRRQRPRFSYYLSILSIPFGCCIAFFPFYHFPTTKDNKKRNK